METSIIDDNGRGLLIGSGAAQAPSRFDLVEVFWTLFGLVLLAGFLGCVALIGA